MLGGAFDLGKGKDPVASISLAIVLKILYY